MQDASPVPAAAGGFLAAPGVTVRDLDGEIVALDARSNRIHQLNEVASLIWRLATAGGTPQAIVDAVVAGHEVEREVAARDVDEALGRMRSLGLLVAR